jgi:hypothetical protein
MKLVHYLKPTVHFSYINSLYRGGTYQNKENQIQIVFKFLEWRERITIQHSGFVKKDCLDLQALYPTSTSKVDELYEFVAFNY